MASLVKELVEAGIHFGHRSSNWNPKMAPYIFGKRNKIHILDVKETIKGLLLARKYITRMVAEGKDVLFVATKRQARAIVEQNVRDVGMYYVTERWLGGTLTNFRTIHERLKRLDELEQIEESGEIDNYSKKMEASLQREKAKILRNLAGLRNMTKLPGCMVVVDVNHEINAVKEARKLGIPTVCLIDTDSNPDYADIAIPGNDDAMRAIEVVVSSLCAAVAEGKRTAASAAQAKERQTATGEKNQGEGESASQPSRRSGRAAYRAQANPPSGEGQEAAEPAPSAAPTKMGPAEAEGDSEKGVTSPVGQRDTTPSDHASPPQEPAAPESSAPSEVGSERSS